MKYRTVLVFLLVSLLLCACSSQRMEKSDSDLSDEERPSMLLHNAVYSLSTGKAEPITVHASTISLDDKSKKATLVGVTFFQKDEAGTEELSGKADRATANLESLDAVLEGNITISKKKDRFTIEAQKIIWDNGDETISSADSGEVFITFDGKNTILSRGFFGNLKSGTYEFQTIEQGVIRL